MGRQSGPYRASETLDTTDILHITGVLYAGEPADIRMRSASTNPSYSRVGHREYEVCGPCIVLISTNVLIDLRRSKGLHSRSSASPRSLRQGARGDRQKDRKRTIGRLRRSGLTSLLRVCYEGNTSVSADDRLSAGRLRCSQSLFPFLTPDFELQDGDALFRLVGFPLHVNRLRYGSASEPDPMLTFDSI